MTVAVDKRRRSQPVRGIDLPVGLRLKPGSDFDNAAFVNRNVDAFSSVGKVGIPNN
jgi:hypothetical protein